MAFSSQTPDWISMILEAASLTSYQEAAESWVKTNRCKLSHLEDADNAEEFAVALELPNFSRKTS